MEKSREEQGRRNQGVDPFTTLMFGKREEPEAFTPPHDAPFTVKMNHFISHLDYDELFDHVDNLVSSAKELKPLLGKMTPFIEQFLKKE